MCGDRCPLDLVRHSQGGPMSPHAAHLHECTVRRSCRNDKTEKLTSRLRYLEGPGAPGGKGAMGTAQVPADAGCSRGRASAWHGSDTRRRRSCGLGKEGTVGFGGRVGRKPENPGVPPTRAFLADTRRAGRPGPQCAQLQEAGGSGQEARGRGDGIVGPPCPVLLIRGSDSLRRGSGPQHSTFLARESVTNGRREPDSSKTKRRETTSTPTREAPCPSCLPTAPEAPVAAVRCALLETVAYTGTRYLHLEKHVVGFLRVKCSHVPKRAWHAVAEPSSRRRVPRCVQGCPVAHSGRVPCLRAPG